MTWPQEIKIKKQIIVNHFTHLSFSFKWNVNRQYSFKMFIVSNIVGFNIYYYYEYRILYHLHAQFLAWETFFIELVLVFCFVLFISFDSIIFLSFFYINYSSYLRLNDKLYIMYVPHSTGHWIKNVCLLHAPN